MEEVHLIGTNVKVTVSFYNEETPAALADVTTLKYLPRLDHDTVLGAEVVLVPADKKQSTGVYAFNYAIPSDIDVATWKEIVLIVTATVGGYAKVVDVPIEISWRS
jgi:hypothetical protein